MGSDWDEACYYMPDPSVFTCWWDESIFNSGEDIEDTPDQVMNPGISYGDICRVTEKNQFLGEMIQFGEDASKCDKANDSVLFPDGKFKDKADINCNPRYLTSFANCFNDRKSDSRTKK